MAFLVAVIKKLVILVALFGAIKNNLIENVKL